ncbi:hypothetical protein QL919_03470 [Psychrobacter sp. APC 3426]|uniref:DUF6880 family protein n=1 Tax=Psychrobacter sp. APC 3426 TaxID=3035177 RepID=UPI0025B5A657|nr:DUF6880 family protein [Psychrobacter sp. APC 3426]MDN3397784.1 hypothetical protein [Psychrobacter sp. APC 3426]
MLDTTQKRSLSQLPKATLVDFVSDVYGVDKLLDKKIERLLLQSDKPKLIKKLTSNLKGLRRRRKFLDYWEYSDFVTELHYLADDVMSLYPERPKACLDLLELFIDSTDSSLERVDDSYGEIGDLYRSLTSSWLKVAATCYQQEKQILPVDEQDILSHAWLEKVKAMDDDNDYGTKDNLLAGIGQLFSEPEIRGLISDYQQEYETILIKEADHKEATKGFKKRDYEVDYTISQEKSRIESALEEVAKALGDVGLFEVIYREIHPKRPLHPRYLVDLIEFLMDAEAYNLALGHLTDEWQSDDLQYKLKRLELLNQIYEQQNDIEAQLKVLGEAFELQPSVRRLKAVMAIATPAQQAYWRKKSYELAAQQDEVVTAISLLLALGEVDFANKIAVKRHTEFTDLHYITLTQLLKELPAETDLLQVIIYRSLLDDILDNARTKAYGHAARYYKKLFQLDFLVSKMNRGYNDLITPQAYTRALIQKHGKKYSFWERVEN